MLLPTWSEDFTPIRRSLGRRARRGPTAFSDEDARRAIVQAYKMSVSPSLLADVLEEPTVSWSMPPVLQVVGIWSACRAQLAPARRDGVLPQDQLGLARLRARHRVPDQTRA